MLNFIIFVSLYLRKFTWYRKTYYECHCICECMLWKLVLKEDKYQKVGAKLNRRNLCILTVLPNDLSSTTVEVLQ